MNVFISGDIEGITGIASPAQCAGPGNASFDWQFARQMYTHDINAAIRGARKAGAKRVVVKDAHGNSKNLLLTDLEKGTELISGHGSGLQGMVEGLDDSFDAIMLIGYHPMAGTTNGIMDHTISGAAVHRSYINDQPIGEMSISAGVAGHYGVPLVTVTSDRAGCDEAEKLFPGVQTAAVKYSFGRYMARLLPPEQTADLIEAAAQKGLEERATKPVKYDGPVTFKIEFHQTAQADMASKLPGSKRVDAYSVAYTGDTYMDAQQGAWMLITVGGVGSSMSG